MLEGNNCLMISSHTLERIYLWTIRGCLFVIPLLSLWVSRSLLFPYITGRNFAFRILVEIALALFAGLIMFKREYLPKLSPVMWALIAFMLIVGAANLLGVNPYNSFWSRYERMEGYIMLLHLAVYFVILAGVFPKKRDWDIFFHFFLAAGIGSGLYAVGQKLHLFQSIQGADRVDGTIGNPTYLAGYLLFIFAIALIYMFRARRLWVRYSYGAAALFSLFVIYLTASRGPILALLAVATVFPLLYIFFAKGQPEEIKLRKKIAAIALAAVVIIPVVFWSVRGTVWVRSSPILSRFANISLTEKTTRARFMIWQMSWEGFKERPILGWGQENYVDVFAKYYNPKLFDQEAWFDRSHNIIFDWLINAGALGLLSYLFLMGSALVLIWQLYRREKILFGETAILGLTLIAYLLQNIFVFDSFNTYILYFAFLAYIHYLYIKTPERIGTEGKDARGAHTDPFYAFMVTGVGLLVMGSTIYFANIRPMQESRELINVLNLLYNHGSVDQVGAQFEKTLSYHTFGDNEVREQLGRLAFQLADNNQASVESRVKFIQMAIASIEQEVKDDLLDIKAHLLLGTLYNRGVGIDPSYINKAKEHIDEAIRLSPTRETSYFLLADNYLTRNDFPHAIEVLKEAVKLEPHFIGAQMNLAFIALNANQGDITEQAFQDVMKDLPPDYHSGSDAQAFTRVADLYVQKQNFVKARQWYEAIVSINPDNAQYHANLGGIYLRLGQKEKAIAEVKRAAEIDPDHFSKQADDFIKSLQ
jgi:O-antigen ligase/TPR repeat protein